MEVYRRRTDSDWLYTDYRGTDASCRLDSLDCEVPLASIYQGVRFARRLFGAACLTSSDGATLGKVSAHPKLTPEQYLELDRAAEVRSEYYRGEMFEMPPSTLRHSGLVSRTMAALYPIVQRRGCGIY